MEKEDLEKLNKVQESARHLVDKEIYENIGLTCQKELKEDPGLLNKAINYYPINEEGKRDDDGDYPEIFEFWSVSEWLGNKLEYAGEIVFDCLDFKVWGRCQTGQSIAMDRAIQKIAIDYGF